MLTIYQHEIKTNIKSLLIWFACVGGMGLFCILLFSSVEGSMESIADSFASMGAFSEAFGMSQLSIATLAGFYATEVGTIHTLGGAMFAAILSTGMLSKEEDGHTSEFLFTLPVSRVRVVTVKWLAVLTHIVFFNLLCIGLYLIGIAVLGEEMPMKELFLYHGMQCLMQLEIAAICYAISAFMRKNKLGTGLGIALLFYAFDLIARVIPDLSDYKIISPCSYANAADILSTGKIDETATIIGILVLVISICVSYMAYTKRDLAA